MADHTTSTKAFSECASHGLKGYDDVREGDTISNHASVLNKLGYPVFEEGASSSREVRTPFTATDKGTSSPTSSEPGTSPFSSIEVVKTCIDHRDNDAPVVESNLGSDYGLVDALSDDDSSNDKSSGDVAACNLLCRMTNASPEHRTHGSSVRYLESSDVVQPLQDFNSQRDSYQPDLWKHIAKVRSISTNATPKVSTHNGRVSTPGSPLGSSKRFSGNSRLSFSMREGGFGLHQVNPSLDATKGNAVSHQRHFKHLVSSARQNNNGVLPFELNKATWSKRVLTTQDLIEKFSRWDQDGPETGDDILHKSGDLERTSSVRRTMSLSRHAPPGPPPLCSICQHKAPVFASRQGGSCMQNLS